MEGLNCKVCTPLYVAAPVGGDPVKATVKKKYVKLARLT